MKCAIRLRGFLTEADTPVLPAAGAAAAPSMVLAADTGTGEQKPELRKWVNAG